MKLGQKEAANYEEVIQKFDMIYSGVGRMLVRGREHLANKRLLRIPRRGSVGEGLRMVAKFKRLKRVKVLENETIFQK